MPGPDIPVHNSTGSGLSILGYIRSDSLKAAGVCAFLLVSTIAVCWVVPDDPGRLATGVAGVIFAVGMVRFGLRGLRPQTAPCLKPLAGHGPLREVLAKIDAQLTGPETLHFSRLHLTPDWVVGMYAGIVAFPYRDLVGLKKTSLRNPHGESWMIIVFLADGRREVLHCRNELVALSVLPQLRLRALWVDARENIEELWLQEREDIISQALQRRALLQPTGRSPC